MSKDISCHEERLSKLLGREPACPAFAARPRRGRSVVPPAGVRSSGPAAGDVDANRASNFSSRRRVLPSRSRERELQPCLPPGRLLCLNPQLRRRLLLAPRLKPTPAPTRRRATFQQVAFWRWLPRKACRSNMAQLSLASKDFIFVVTNRASLRGR